MAENGLTAKEELFISHYLGDAKGNGTEAARLAGYKGSDATLATQSWRLLKNAEIRAHIRERLDNVDASAERTIRELSDVAFAEWRDFLLIKTDPKTGETVEVRMDLANKVKSLETLMKYHKLLTDKMQLAGADGGALQIEVVYEQGPPLPTLTPPSTE